MNMFYGESLPLRTQDSHNLKMQERVKEAKEYYDSFNPHKKDKKKKPAPVMGDLERYPNRIDRVCAEQKSYYDALNPHK